MALIRRMAHKALKKNASHKSCVKGKRLRAGWDDCYMEEILLGL